MGPFYKLVFSNNTRFRIARHILFWFIWISFYAFAKSYQMAELDHLSFTSVFPLAWLEILIQIPIDIAFCYLVLYFLLPKLFLKGRYIYFIFLWLILLFTSAALQHLYYFWAIPKFRIAFGLKPPYARGSVFLGALMIVGSLNAEGAFAAAIRLGKLFFIKEKETDLLLKEIKRINPEGSQAQETSLQPTFLYNVLNRLYSMPVKEDIDPAETIKKINDLILYAGYDAKKTMLPLSKELDALNEYIELEKLSYDYPVHVSYQITGQPGNKMIIPYVLIPLVENAFSSMGRAGDEPPSLDIEVRIQDDDFFVKIRSSKSSESSTLLGQKNINVLNIERRLQLRYPGGYQLKKVIEPEKLELTLQLDLSARLGI
jgi:sensor histidine kinase YesM